MNAYISLTNAAQAEAIEAFPALGKCSSFVIPHGSYKGEYPDTISQADARILLGVHEAETVFVSLGLVRRYKNILILISCFREMADPNAALIVAGECNDEKLANEIREAASSDARVTVDLTFVPRERVQIFLRAADVVVQPYSVVLNSGSTLLALSFDRPILVPRQGSLRELEEHFGPDWVLTYDGLLTSRRLAEAGAFAKKLDGGQLAELQRHISELSWTHIAQSHIEAYRTILSNAGQGPSG